MTPGIDVGYWKARKMPGLGPFVGLELEQVDAVDGRRALGDFVIRVAHQGVAQRALARAVRPHQGMDLALADRQVDPFEDLLAIDRDVQVVDLENFAHPSVSPVRMLGRRSRWCQTVLAGAASGDQIRLGLEVARAVAVEPALAEP